VKGACFHGSCFSVWIEAAKAEGKSIPEPSYYKDEYEYSGKLTIRISKRLQFRRLSV
jgi:hypothetical protein